MARDIEYERICKKLGFVLSEYKYEPVGTEDDNVENPFLKLTDEECEYLYINGYLNKQ